MRAAVLLPLALACGPRRGPAPPAHPERLDGVWLAEFHETFAAALIADTGGVRTAEGRVVLLPNPEHRRVRGLRGIPTHFGAYDADLRPLGIPASPDVPTLAVRLTRKDSVQIALDPQERVPVLGSGVLWGDSITGTWRTEGGRNVGGSGGTFVLRRGS